MTYIGFRLSQAFYAPEYMWIWLTSQGKWYRNYPVSYAAVRHSEQIYVIYDPLFLDLLRRFPYTPALDN